MWAPHGGIGYGLDSVGRFFVVEGTPVSSTALASVISGLSTPLIADACLRVGVPVRVAPAGLVPVVPGICVGGRAVPVRHHGSVDLFLEAIVSARPGEVLVIDNGGRYDEACIGDLTALEARHAGLVAIVLWGLHRDHLELQQLAFPVFSYGRCPAGPLQLESRHEESLISARFGDLLVTGQDVVIADDDGAAFVPAIAIDAVLVAAQVIRERERDQALRVASGVSLREQFRFDLYLERRASNPDLTFRQHLDQIGGAIEV